VELHKGNQPFASAADRVILGATVVFGYEPGDCAWIVDSS
jgi:hypothetical protein